jgi:ABC-type glycerol-3-phosphate transport system substrate-binding protein
MSIAAKSGKKLEAWEFLKYLVSEEGQQMVNEDGASIPALGPIARSDAFLHHRTTPLMSNHVFIDELPASVTWPYEQGPYLSAYTLQSQLELAVGRVLLRQASVSRSLKMMEDEVNRIIRVRREVPSPRPFAGSVACVLSVCILLLVPLVLIVHRRKRSRPEPAL